MRRNNVYSQKICAVKSCWCFPYVCCCFDRNKPELLHSESLLHKSNLIKRERFDRWRRRSWSQEVSTSQFRVQTAHMEIDGEFNEKSENVSWPQKWWSYLILVLTLSHWRSRGTIMKYFLLIRNILESGSALSCCNFLSTWFCRRISAFEISVAKELISEN